MQWGYGLALFMDPSTLVALIHTALSIWYLWKTWATRSSFCFALLVDLEIKSFQCIFKMLSEKI